MALWLAAEPLVLASQSKVRRALLEAAAIPVEACPADLDERALEKRAGVSGPSEAAALLAREKALAVVRERPGRMIVGADQTLALDQRRFNKPDNREAAAEQLRLLRGKTHALHSAVAVARDGKVMFSHVAIARLTVRDFSEEFLAGYLDAAGDKVLASVGGYQLEGLGSQLFERVDGDYFTVLGLPLLPLLGFLRQSGCLAA